MAAEEIDFDVVFYPETTHDEDAANQRNKVNGICSFRPSMFASLPRTFCMGVYTKLLYSIKIYSNL